MCQLRRVRGLPSTEHALFRSESHYGGGLLQILLWRSGEHRRGGRWTLVPQSNLQVKIDIWLRAARRLALFEESQCRRLATATNCGRPRLMRQYVVVVGIACWVRPGSCEVAFLDHRIQKPGFVT